MSAKKYPKDKNNQVTMPPVLYVIRYGVSMTTSSYHHHIQVEIRAIFSVTADTTSGQTKDIMCFWLSQETSLHDKLVSAERKWLRRSLLKDYTSLPDDEGLGIPVLRY